MARRPSTKAAPAMAPVAAGRHAVDEGLARVGLSAKRRKYGAGMIDEQVAGQEDADRGRGRAERPGDEVADEGDGDDDRPGRDHRDRDRVEELPLGQPVVLVDDAAVEERHDRQAAAEHERARLREVEGDLASSVPDARRCAVRPASSQPTRREAPRPALAPAGSARTTSDDARRSSRNSQTISDLGPCGDDGADREERPEQPVLAERHAAPA